jgi:iron(III) transport system ATP-binding protein
VIKLRIKNLGCDYGSAVAVHDFSLEIAQAEFISLLGPSGCGKTTMLRMIAGFIQPTRGTIELNGRVISSPERVLSAEERGMSMIFQSYAIWPNMTVFQNVAFGLEVRRLPAAKIRERVSAMLDVVKLSSFADRYPAELSGGQQQRVALARAVVVQPEVMLLDEPLSNLDANLREEMRFEIRRMHDEFKITTVYVTHDQAEAMVASDRIVVMRDGRIEQVDTPRAIYREPATRFVASFIGRTNFLSGKRAGDTYDFGTFGIPAQLFSPQIRDRNAIVMSVRPHDLRIAAAGEPPDIEAIALAGKITERAYFGDHWDYTVRLSDGSALIISTDPGSECRIDQAVNVLLDPCNAAVIADDGGTPA